MDQVLLFCDVVDSTQHVQRLGDIAASEWWTAHDHSARELLIAYEGQEIDRTDGFFALFNNPSQAVCFAEAYHEAMRRLGSTARVGLHVGPLILRRNPESHIARAAKPVEADGLAKSAVPASWVWRSADRP